MSENKITLPIEKTCNYFIEQIGEMSDDDIICRANCKFCRHPARAEAEMMWEQSKNYMSIVKFFAEYRKTHPETDPMSHPNVRVHIKNHYESQERNIYMREYGQKMSKFMSYKVEKDKQLEELISIARYKVFEIDADPHISTTDKATAIAKLSKTILEISEMQAKLRGDINSEDIVLQRLYNAFSFVVGKTDDKQVKDALVEALELFQNKVDAEVVE